MKSEPLLFRAAAKLKAALLYIGFALAVAFAFVFMRRRRDLAPVIPMTSRTAGELARLKDEEARRRALEKRAKAEAEALKQAEHDADVTDLADYVRSRKSGPGSGAGPDSAG